MTQKARSGSRRRVVEAAERAREGLGVLSFERCKMVVDGPGYLRRARLVLPAQNFSGIREE